MATLMEIWAWFMANYIGVFISLAGLVATAESIVRLTPTKKDDGAVQRIGEILKKVMDIFKIPNLTVGDDGKLAMHKKKKE